MTISETLSDLANGFRKLEGETKKYSVAEMAQLLPHLQTRNYISDPSPVIKIGAQYKLSFDFLPGPNSAYPFYVVTGVLPAGTYAFEADLKGTNTTQAEIMMYSFSSDNGDASYTFAKNVPTDQHCSLQIIVQQGKPYRLIIYSVADGLNGTGKGNELVELSNASLTRITQ